MHYDHLYVFYSTFVSFLLCLGEEHVQSLIIPLKLSDSVHAFSCQQFNNSIKSIINPYFYCMKLFIFIYNLLYF